MILVRFAISMFALALLGLAITLSSAQSHSGAAGAASVEVVGK